MRSIPLRVFVLFISLLVAGVPVVAQHRSTPPPRHDRPATVRNYRETALSADGKRVAWVDVFDGAGAPSSGPSGIFVADLAMGGRMPRRITASDDQAGCAEHSIAWSPDGRQLAFLSDRDQAGQLQVHVAPADGVEARRLTTGSGFLHDWSPDGTHCVAIAAHGSGDDHWYIAQLYVLAMATGKARSIRDPKMQVAVTGWSPDGRTIAFIGGLMSDEGVTGGDIYLVPATGGTARNLTPALDGWASWLGWHRSSGSLFTAEHRDGGSGLARMGLDGGVTRLWESAER
jgi:Tol biopolymer transport system component